MARLPSRTAIVTGAAGGIGYAIALRLAEEGANVALADIDGEGAHFAAETLRQRELSAVGIAHDVTSADDWQTVFATAAAQFGKVDILVNNAGLALVASIEDVSFEDWRRILSVNLDGVFLGTQAAIAVMKQRGGSIINLSSIRALVGDPMSVAYDASKAGVTALTRSSALHCAKQGYGIRINSIHPSYVMTDMVRNAIEAMPNSDEIFRSLIERHPVGRLGDARDIANAALFLASDESAFIVGTQIVIDGGYCAQ